MKTLLLRISLLVSIGIICINSTFANSNEDDFIDPSPIESMVIPFVGDPIIDGVMDGSYLAPFFLTNILTFTNGEFTGQSDHYVRVQTGWGDKGMYFYFEVTDDIDKGAILDWGMDGIELKINPDKSNDGTDFEWKDDAIEIGVVRGVSDKYRYHIVDVDGEGTEGNGPGINGETVDMGPRSGLPGVEFFVINEKGSYKVEMLVPWLFVLPLGTTEADIPSWREKEMGFDIHVHDNDLSDDNGGRDHSLIWDTDGDPSSTDADRANKNTSLLGNITFGVLTSIKSEVVSSLNIYPNPAKRMVTIENLEDINSITISDALGRVIKTISPENTTLNIDVSDMDKGLYIICSTDNLNNVYVNRLIVE